MSAASMPASPSLLRGAAAPRALAWLAAAAALLLLGLALRPAAHVYDMPLTEDGYYALAVARNVAAGKGITIDGVNLTNGFQPLFTFLEAGAFRLAGGDEILAMRLVIALSWLFHLATALLVAAIARDAWPARDPAERAWRAPLAAFLCLAAPLLLNHAYNGLETGAVLFFYALAWRLMQTGAERSWGGLAAFGAAIGLMVLTRIDAAFLALVLGLNELRKSRQGGLASLVGRGAVLGGTALLISSPWWIYNTLYFGSPMPTSGTAQQAWALEWLRFEFAEWALRVAAVPWLFAGAHEGALSVDLPWPLGPAGYVTVTATGVGRAAILAAILGLIARAVRRGTLRADLAAAPPDQALTTRRTLEFAACFALAMAGLVLYYLFSFVAYWFYYRYFAPVAVFATVAAALLWARLWAAGATGPARRAHAALAALLAAQIAALALLGQAGRGIGGNTVYHDQVALARELVPAGAEVAAGQTGTLGFFRERVVNLDGKVNPEALRHQDRMWEYLRARDIRWFVDWPHYVNKYLGVALDPATDVPAPAGNGWRRVAERNYFYLYEYVGEAARP